MELDIKFGPRDWVQNISNNSIYLNPAAIKAAPATAEIIQRYVSALCVEEDAVLMAVGAHDLASRAAVDPIVMNLYRGHKQGDCGDVLLVLNPGWMNYGRTGTTHGSPFAYDTHVPCLFYGAGVESGKTYDKSYTRDVAPTMSALLGIPYPNGTTGSPIHQALK